MNRELFNRLTAPLRARVALMVGRGVVTLVDDSKGLQSVQVAALSDEIVEQAERFQDYGVTSAPHPEAEAAFACVGGLRSHALVLAIADRRYRLKGLQTGEVALYDDLGQVVHLTREGVVIRSAQAITLEAPAVSIDASDEVTITSAKIVLDGDVHLGGEGGQLVARKGDAVVGGVITGSATKVRAV